METQPTTWFNMSSPLVYRTKMEEYRIPPPLVRANLSTGYLWLVVPSMKRMYAHWLTPSRFGIAVIVLNAQQHSAVKCANIFIVNFVCSFIWFSQGRPMPLLTVPCFLRSVLRICCMQILNIATESFGTVAGKMSPLFVIVVRFSISWNWFSRIHHPRWFIRRQSSC